MIFKRAQLLQHYQHYAMINPAACPACLSKHGELFTDLSQAPPHHEGCRCQYLPVAAQELKEKKEQGQRMQAKAQAELQRRGLFRQGMELLAQDPERGLEALQAAAAIDVYIEELEQLHRRHRKLLERDGELAQQLYKLFTQAHYDKMDQPKYRWISQGLYAQLESQGRRRIQALFAAPFSP